MGFATNVRKKIGHGGHYVPQLAQLIVQSNVKFNLKGIAIWRSAIRGFQSRACTFVTSQLEKELSDFTDPYNVIGDELKEKEDVCARENTQEYLNRKDVQKALHAQLLGFNQWSLCRSNSILRYDLKNEEIPTIGVVGSLVKSGIRALVYSGDQDAVIPFTGTRTLVNGLAKELGLKTTVPYRPWFEGKQVGGWTQVYGNIQLSFASVRGASHKVPVAQPARSLVLFKAFLAGKPLPEA
uniref:Carboxypeptidase n=1 Tax=Fagus sylvatica TaxID=28930 RepID=A0A2N9EQC6_FAGSY